MRLFAPDDGTDKRMRKRLRMYGPTQAAASDCIGHPNRLHQPSQAVAFIK